MAPATTAAEGGEAQEHEQEQEPSCWDTVKPYLVPIYTPALFRGVADSVALAAVPLFAASLGMDHGQVGACASAVAAGQLAGDLPAGVISSVIGIRYAMVVGMLGYGVAAALSSLSTSFYPLFFCLLIAGFTESTYAVARQAFMRAVIPSHMRGRTTSALGGVNRATRAIGPIFGGYLAHHTSVAMPLVFRGTLSSIGALTILWALPKEMADKASGKSPSREHHGFQALWSTLKSHRRIFMTAGVVVVMLSFIRSVRNFLVTMRAAELGLSHRDIGVVVAIGYVVDALLFAPVGFAMDKYGRRRTSIPAMAIFSLGLVALSFSNSMLTMCLSAMLIGFGNGLSSGLVMILGSDLSPTGNEAAAFLGLWNLVMDTGSTTGPLITGYLSEHGFGLSGAARITAVVAAVGACWYYISLPETLRRPTVSKTQSDTAAVKVLADDVPDATQEDTEEVLEMDTRPLLRSHVVIEGTNQR